MRDVKRPMPRAQGNQPPEKQPVIQPYGDVPNQKVGKEISSTAKTVGLFGLIVNCILFCIVFMILMTGSTAKPTGAQASGASAAAAVLQFVLLGAFAGGAIISYFVRKGSIIAMLFAAVVQGLASMLFLLVAAGSGGNSAVLIIAVVSVALLVMFIAALVSQLSTNRGERERASMPAPELPPARGPSPMQESVKIIGLACQLSDDHVEERSQMALKMASEYYGQKFSQQLADDLDGILGNPAATDELQQWTPALIQTSNAALKKRVVQVVKKLLTDGSQESAGFCRQLVSQLGFTQ